MPLSKEAIARQNRQKERVAAQLVERRRQQRRRRVGGTLITIVVFVGLVALVYTVSRGNGGDEKVAVVPTSAPPPEQCVGLKDTLPKGSPAMPIKPGVAPTKLKTTDLKIGTGAVVPKNAKVTMNYVGVTCGTGTIFDSTYANNTTFDADLSSSGQLINGWQQGIPGMRIGGVRLLSIPSDLAYGPDGRPPTIGADEALFFLVSAEKLN
jgi:FKBP-type peptidyl-prolyl cis-trans isomerase